MPGQYPVSVGVLLCELSRTEMTGRRSGTRSISDTCQLTPGHPLNVVLGLGGVVCAAELLHVDVCLGSGRRHQPVEHTVGVP